MSTTQSEPTHTQPALFSPDVVEIQMRLGFVAESNHLQAQCEALNATDDTLLAIKSWPHRPICSLQQVCAEMIEWVQGMASELVQPFPE